MQRECATGSDARSKTTTTSLKCKSEWTKSRLEVFGSGLYVYPSGVAAETQLVGTTVCGNSVRNISGPYQADVTSQVCDCRADLSADGFVNGVDLAIVLSNWGVVGSSADLT
jgi:hypothetical protein